MTTAKMENWKDKSKYMISKHKQQQSENRTSKHVATYSQIHPHNLQLDNIAAFLETKFNCEWKIDSNKNILLRKRLRNLALDSQEQHRT